jgi:hypothetical protein
MLNISGKAGAGAGAGAGAALRYCFGPTNMMQFCSAEINVTNVVKKFIILNFFLINKFCGTYFRKNLSQKLIKIRICAWMAGKVETG